MFSAIHVQFRPRIDASTKPTKRMQNNASQGTDTL